MLLLITILILTSGLLLDIVDYRGVILKLGGHMKTSEKVNYGIWGGGTATVLIVGALWAYVENGSLEKTCDSMHRECKREVASLKLDCDEEADRGSRKMCKKRAKLEERACKDYFKDCKDGAKAIKETVKDVKKNLEKSVWN